MSAPPTTAERPARILIVDDERADRQLMEVLLASEGYVVVTAASGEEALAGVEQQPPDLILLDIKLPGMDGYEVAGNIKDNAATRNIPVILVTALHDHDVRLLGLIAGAETILTKPLSRVDLCAQVRRLLRLKAYGDYHKRPG